MSRGHSNAINWPPQRPSRLRSHVLLACAIFLLSSHYVNAQATFEDISSQVSVTRSGLVLNRVTNTFDCLVQVTNTSAAALSGPLVLSVSSISTTNVTLFNPAGQDASGSAYINLAVPTGGLAPGQTIANSLLKFSNPNRVAFTFSIAVLSQAPSTNGGTTIEDATGGTITVPDPDNPNAMLTILIPPGVLGVASDVISVSFSSTPPGPLRPEAVSAGAHFISSTVTLTRASGLKFLQPIQVTIPYTLSQVGPDDSLVVAFWDTTTNSYDGVATIGLDRVQGTISFQTVHFSMYSAVGVPISLSPSTLSSISGGDLSTDTLFRSTTDGFPIANFTSMVGAASGGACFGLTAFAKWYYETQSSTGQAAPIAYSTTLDKGLVAEDDVDRELIYWSFSDTLQANRDSTFLNLQAKSDYQTANSLFVALNVFDRPQLIVLAKDGSYKAPEGLHSVLVFNYSIDKTNSLVHFHFYDPNDPEVDQDLIYQVNQETFFLPAYTDVFETHYSWAYFNSLSSVAAPSDFGPALTNARNGWPNRHFKEILIDDANSTGITLSSPEGPDPEANPAAYQVLPGTAILAMNWNCSCPPPGISTVYAHIFINGEFSQDIPIQPSPLGTPSPFSYPVPANIFNSAEPELIVIVSEYPHVSGTPPIPMGFDPINYMLIFGYEGFLRIKLQPPLYQVNTLVINAYTDAETASEVDNVFCYPPSSLLSMYPYLYPIASSIVPFSPTVQVACVGSVHEVAAGGPPLIAPLFSDSLSAAFGGSSASASFNMQFNPNTISTSAISSETASMDAETASTRVSLATQMIIPYPVHYAITAGASPDLDRLCYVAASAGTATQGYGVLGAGLTGVTPYPSQISVEGDITTFNTTFGLSVLITCTASFGNPDPVPHVATVSVTLTPLPPP